MSDEKVTSVDVKLMAQPFRYSDLVDYQEGSVVSRTIIKKPEGTVTVFAFDKGERLSTHSAPFDALVEIIDGNATISIEGKDYKVEKGEQIIMPANSPHAVTANGRFKMVLVMIKAKQNT